MGMKSVGVHECEKCGNGYRNSGEMSVETVKISVWKENPDLCMSYFVLSGVWGSRRKLAGPPRLSRSTITINSSPPQSYLSSVISTILHILPYVVPLPPTHTCTVNFW